MSTSGPGSQPADREQLGDNDAPDIFGHILHLSASRPASLTAHWAPKEHTKV